MFWSKKNQSNFHWSYLQSTTDLNNAIEKSKSIHVLIFKHSTRCSISSLAKSRIENNWNDSISIEPYLIDILTYRVISNEISDRFNVVHESPQVLLVSTEKCIGSLSHNEIDVEEILKMIKD